MILILLGTQDKPFSRLLKSVDECINKGYINDKVVVQAGSTKYKSKNMEIFDLIPKDQFENLIDEADLVITHAGIGSILTCLEHNKKVIAAARLKVYGEHTNDHQLQILKEFYEKGYIMKLDDFSKLNEVIKTSSEFKPQKYKSNNENFVKMIENYIDNL